MAAALIYRPEVEKNFTITPNSLFKPALMGLNRRDSLVLNYLLSMPEEWNIIHAVVAREIGYSVGTVKEALTSLVKHGFAQWEKLPNRKTKWIIKVPEQLLEKSQPVAKITEPENPEQGNTDHEKAGRYIKNKDLENNQKTTNAVVVDLPDLINLPDVKSDLSELAKAQQILVLSVWADCMTKGNIKNPVGLVRDFCKKAKAGLLSEPVVVDKTGAKPVDKKKQEFIKRNFDKLKRQLTNVERINIAHPTYDGWIYAKDLEEFEGGRS